MLTKLTNQSFFITPNYISPNQSTYKPYYITKQPPQHFSTHQKIPHNNLHKNQPAIHPIIKPIPNLIILILLNILMQTFNIKIHTTQTSKNRITHFSVSPLISPSHLLSSAHNLCHLKTDTLFEFCKLDQTPLPILLLLPYQSLCRKT